MVNSKKWLIQGFFGFVKWNFLYIKAFILKIVIQTL